MSVPVLVHYIYSINREQTNMTDSFVHILNDCPTAQHNFTLGIAHSVEIFTSYFLISGYL